MKPIILAALSTILLTTWLAAQYPDITHVEMVDCYDGDTCAFNIPNWPPIIGEKIGVRFLGYDTPEIRGKCPEEKKLAREARDHLKELLEGADRITLTKVERGKYFRILSEVHADGQDVGVLLIEAGLARPYDGGRRESWCPDEGLGINLQPMHEIPDRYYLVPQKMEEGVLYVTPRPKLHYDWWWGEPPNFETTSP